MRFFFALFVCFFLLIVNSAAGQEPVKATVAGRIIEEFTKEPMEFVNVAMYHVADSSFEKGVTTNKDGAYLFNNVADGNYYLQISMIGFETIKTKMFTVNKQAIDVGSFSIKMVGKNLKEVVVSSEKSAYETSIDRKVYNVDKDIMGKSGSASEILGNVPSVSVDVDGTVSLRGSSNITFLINGKPSPMMRINSAEALQAMPASAIERIEVITNPSAKYKPDGTAGIINIVLKKDTRSGFNGALIANVGNDSRYNSNIIMNYKYKKINFSGNYAYRQDVRDRKNTDDRILNDSVGNISNFYNQKSISTARPLSNTAQAGVDYTINDKNEIGITGDYHFRDFSRKENTITIIKDVNSEIVNQYIRLRIDPEYELEKTVGGHYIHKFKKEDSELNIEFNANYQFEQEDNHFTNTYQIPVSVATKDNTLIQQGENGSDVTAEYNLPINEESEFAVGFEGEYFTKDFNFIGEYFDANQGEWIKDKQKSNEFIFTQNVSALYSTYERSIEDFSFIAGLRAERAMINSNLVTLDSVIPNNYFSLYPTLHLSYEFSDEQQLQLNYSRRVNRPDDEDLNPFPEYRDPRNLRAGNPNLKPEQIHSLELGYQLKNTKITFVPSVFYRYQYNTFTQITKYINDSTLLTTHENISKEQSEGIELVLAAQIKKTVTLNFSSDGFYRTIDASALGYSGSKGAFAWNAKLSASANLGKSSMIQVNTNYSSSTLSPQGKYFPVFVLNTGMRQDIFKKKASLSLTVSDVFNTLNRTSEVNTLTLHQKVVNKRTSQIIYIGFTYRFGKSAKKTSDELKFDEKM